jgi:hypothetical protein
MSSLTSLSSHLNNFEGSDWEVWVLGISILAGGINCVNTLKGFIVELCEESNELPI